MFRIQSQVHGYRQGHQLLSSSIALPKTDQATIDQLSDVAGPLRPGENFDPYLSGYPLPSGDHYVMARTWQDLMIRRAGCVRTLSFVVPMAEWIEIEPATLIGALDGHSFPDAASTIAIGSGERALLPPLASFDPDELLEAMFLEDPKPIVLFDASDPDLLATRLLTAFWPQLRASYAFSTFALSPRKIGGRFFDLVLAPADARARFVDWPGRRLDARTSSRQRHRWTESLVTRVFENPTPELLGDRERRFLANAPTPAAGLRMALRWQELQDGLVETPTNILGLLDLVITARDPVVSRQLASELNRAVERVVNKATPTAAWMFLIALSRKLASLDLPTSGHDVSAGVRSLTRRAPIETTAILDDPVKLTEAESLLPEIADTLAELPISLTEVALSQGREHLLARFVTESPAFARTLIGSTKLLDRLVASTPSLPNGLAVCVRSSILPLLVKEESVGFAQTLISSLNEHELLEEASLVASLTSAPLGLGQAIALRARAEQLIPRLRSHLLELPSSHSRDELIRATLVSTIEDVRWLLLDDLRSDVFQKSVLLELLRAIPEDSFRALARDRMTAERILEEVPEDAMDILARLALDSSLPLGRIVSILRRITPELDHEQARNAARFALDRCLRDPFDGDEITSVVAFLDVLGPDLDGTKAVRIGLNRDVRSDVVNRNMRAFDGCGSTARSCIVQANEEMAIALTKRRQLDLDQPAAEAAARLMSDAHRQDLEGALRADGTLLPTLMSADRCPVSSIIAVAFPPIYRELAREEEDVPEILKFVPFVDWDRCKTARRELVDAFMRSQTWNASDLALTACRASEVRRIIRRAAKSHKGADYVRRIEDDLNRLPLGCRQMVSLEIANVRNDPAVRLAPRD